MGRPRVKTIDDSQPEAEIKKEKIIRKDSENSDKPENQTTGESEAQKSDISEAPAIQSSDKSGTPSSSESSEKTTSKKTRKPGKAKPRSKKYQEAAKDLDRGKAYPLDEALDLVKKVSYSRFTGTLEAHINTSQTGIRGLVSLPFASGRKLTIAAFGKGAESSGADLVGSDELIEEINKGKVAFDLLVTTPEWMPKLAKVARILGPRGLMPNPKNGTITDDLKRAVTLFQAGKTEYKTEAKAPVIHISLGKLNQPNEELKANIKALLQILGKTRVKKITLSPTMGPVVKVMQDSN